MIKDVPEFFILILMLNLLIKFQVTEIALEFMKTQVILMRKLFHQEMKNYSELDQLYKLV